MCDCFCLHGQTEGRDLSEPLSSCTVPPLCLTVNPQPDQSLVTEQSVYIMMSSGMLLALTSICTSALTFPAGHSRQCVPRISDSRASDNSMCHHTKYESNRFINITMYVSVKVLTQLVKQELFPLFQTILLKNSLRMSN